MRNIFDQYTQPENRLTHSLVMALYEDSDLLKSFILTFVPESRPPKGIKIIEQGLPGSIERAEVEDEDERRGLPDAVIFNDDGWAIVIESKLAAPLTKDQLQRHYKTITKCGFDKIYGLTITTSAPDFEMQGWRATTWREIYAWAGQQKGESSWARRMMEYFDIVESKMIADETITKFSGISFDPYTYPAGKRVLRLLMEKLRADGAFIRAMGLSDRAERNAISNQTHLWDFIEFKQTGQQKNFTKYPHCTVAIGESLCGAYITFPNGMETKFRKQLCEDSPEAFLDKINQAALSIRKNLKDISGYKPIFRVMQRHYPSRKSEPVMDGIVEFDLRVALGGTKQESGTKKQVEWINAAYELIQSKKSNIQVQIGVAFSYGTCEDLKTEDADELFIKTFIALKSFVDNVVRP